MNLYPDKYLANIKEITIEMLEENRIKGLILDIDNTLIDYDKKLLPDADKWCNNLKQKGIKMCILSNTNKVEKVRNVANKLNLEYLYFAGKPGKRGFYKAKSLLNLENENIAVVGDQIFTDVWGGNRAHMFTILTKPIDSRDYFYTKVKRPFEKVVINRYLKKIKSRKE